MVLVEEIQTDLNCGHDKITKLVVELEVGKGFGLIERKKQGQGKPARVYVKRFTTRAIPPQPPAPPPSANLPRRRNPRNPPKPPTDGKATPPTGTVTPGKPAEEKKPPEPSEDTPATEDDEGLPKNLKIPLTPDGQPETVEIVSIADIHQLDGHPFNVNDDKDMWDLVDSVTKFGVLEPAVIIPRKEGGYGMISGHRRHRAC